jgi:hypothetical protein
MITISGIYDGVNIVPLGPVNANANSRVSISFIDDPVQSPETELQEIVSSLNFNFWGNEREEYDSLEDK